MAVGIPARPFSIPPLHALRCLRASCGRCGALAVCTSARVRADVHLSGGAGQVCGASYDGVGVNDCIVSGRKAAETYVAEAFVAGRFA